MKATVYETPLYREAAARLLSEEERRELRSHLAQNPLDSDIIPGLGGLRKARWGRRSRNKGKRGGVRVIYFMQFRNASSRFSICIQRTKRRI